MGLQHFLYQKTMIIQEINTKKTINSPKRIFTTRIMDTSCHIIHCLIYMIVKYFQSTNSNTEVCQANTILLALLLLQLAKALQSFIFCSTKTLFIFIIFAINGISMFE